MKRNMLMFVAIVLIGATSWAAEQSATKKKPVPGFARNYGTVHFFQPVATEDGTISLTSKSDKRNGPRSSALGDAALWRRESISLIVSKGSLSIPYGVTCVYLAEEPLPTVRITIGHVWPKDKLDPRIDQSAVLEATVKCVQRTLRIQSKRRVKIRVRSATSGKETKFKHLSGIYIHKQDDVWTKERETKRNAGAEPKDMLVVVRDIDRKLIEAVTKIPEDGRRKTPGNVELAKALLHQGANPNLAVREPNTFGAFCSLLRYAVIYGDAEMCATLIKYGADPHYRGLMGRAVPHAHGSKDAGRRAAIVKLLIEAGVNVQINYFLRRAVRYEYLDIIRVILDAGGDLDDTSVRGWTTLHTAVAGSMVHAENWQQVAAYLMTCETAGKPTAKMYARFQHSSVNASMVTFLIQQGAAINPKGNLGLTPLQLARISGNDRIADILIKAGADPKIKDQSGHVPDDYKGLAKKWGLIYEPPPAKQER